MNSNQKHNVIFAPLWVMCLTAGHAAVAATDLRSSASVTPFSSGPISGGFAIRNTRSRSSASLTGKPEDCDQHARSPAQLELNAGENQKSAILRFDVPKQNDCSAFAGVTLALAVPFGNSEKTALFDRVRGGTNFEAKGTWKVKGIYLSPSVAFGYDEFEYLDATATALSTRKFARSGSFGAAFAWSGRNHAAEDKDNNAFFLNYSVASSYENNSDSNATICTPFVNEKLKCISGFLSAPKQTTSRIAKLGYAHIFHSFGMQLVGTRDIVAHKTIVEVPLYLPRGENRIFDSGIKVVWSSDTKQVRVGLFVSTPLEFP